MNIFTGLVKAMVTKVSCEECGVGMQNMQYNPAYDEFVHIIKISSGQVFRFLSEHLPTQSECSYR